MARPTTSALATTERLSADEFTKILQAQGFSEKGSATPRISLTNGMLTTPTGGTYVYNPRKPAEPAMTVRILKPLDEYYAIWIDDPIARELGRPELANTFAKKWMKHSDDHVLWDSDTEYDRVKSLGHKSSWKGDLLVAIAPDDGQFTGNEIPHMLTLSTTSVIEFKGSSKEPQAGSISDMNFIQKLIRFAVDNSDAKNKAEAETAVLNALTSYSLGGVVAEIRTGIGENKEMGMTWTVLIFDPIHIEPLNERPALETGNDEDPGL